MVFIVILFGQVGWAQSTDIFRIEYLNIPENDTGIMTQRYKGLFNLPIKLNEKKDYLITGLEYNRFDMGYSRNLPFDKSELIRFHIIDLNVGLLTKWNENWNLVGILTPRLASNFISGGIETEDFFMNATVTFWKERMDADRPFRLVLGLTYNSTTGLPVPLPLINYYRRFHPDWSFTFGIPRSDLRRYFGKKHFVELALFLDGYFINLQNDIPMMNGEVASKISLTSLYGAFGYQYNVSKRMAFFAMVGRSIVQEGKLRNNDQGDVFLLNDESNLYIRTGFKIGIF
ncbi:DUF6268 family outer membrane beta-barrel protein [Flagellimonas beolgyonensis]|uniref:DUF6268 family outer membrane beta-barrel protein n=1 Tax=Flagellimonas beolgyonensis TaxID=864064 RepID=UPI003D65B35D